MNKDMMPAHWTEDGPYGTPVSLKPAPIAWISRSPTNGDILHWSKKKALEYSSDIYPLYGAPPKREWVGLTNEEIGLEWHYLHDDEGKSPDEWVFARAIEAKLKGKNHG